MILVLGANGQLGQCLKSLWGSDAIYLDKDHSDITKYDVLKASLEKYSPKYVINCAAFTNVDKCESEVEACHAVNGTGPSNLAKLSRELKYKLIHISTDYVFDGKGNTPYHESNQTNPVSEYGKSKLAGEESIQEESDQYMIIRTSWLYSEFAQNFVKNIKKHMETKEQMGIVFDQVGSPTYAIDLARGIKHIIDEGLFHSGIYHFSNRGVASWYDLAMEVRNYFKLDCKLAPIESHEYPLPAKRPHYSVLSSRKFEETFSYENQHWKKSLYRCLKTFKN